MSGGGAPAKRVVDNAYPKRKHELHCGNRGLKQQERRACVDNVLETVRRCPQVRQQDGLQQEQAHHVS